MIIAKNIDNFSYVFNNILINQNINIFLIPKFIAIFVSAVESALWHIMLFLSFHYIPYGRCEEIAGPAWQYKYILNGGLSLPLPTSGMNNKKATIIENHQDHCKHLGIHGYLNASNAVSQNLLIENRGYLFSFTTTKSTVWHLLEVTHFPGYRGSQLK